MVTAHSGSEKTGNNTEKFLDYVRKTNPDAFEVDVRKSRGELVLWHDEVPEGMEAVRLTDAFQLMKENEDICINCDMKQEGMAEEVYQLAKEYGLLERLIFSGSVSLTEIKEFPNLSKVSRVFYNVENILPKFYSYSKEEIEQQMELVNTVDFKQLKELGITVINISFRHCSEEFLHKMKEEQMGLSVWTVDEPQVMKQMLACPQVINITSNYPRLVKQQ